MIPQDPGSISLCGREPGYYEINSIGRFESFEHISWENCVADYARNHVPTYIERHYPEPSPAAADPYVPPLDTSMNGWIQEHNDLLITFGVIAVFVVVFLFLWTHTRRVNRAAENARQPR